MTRFADIYLKVVKARTLRDDIAVEELPVSVQEALQQDVAKQEACMSAMRKDKERAMERLTKMKEQLAAARRLS